MITIARTPIDGRCVDCGEARLVVTADRDGDLMVICLACGGPTDDWDGVLA